MTWSQIYNFLDSWEKNVWVSIPPNSWSFYNHQICGIVSLLPNCTDSSLPQCPSCAHSVLCVLLQILFTCVAPRVHLQWNHLCPLQSRKVSALVLQLHFSLFSLPGTSIWYVEDSFSQSWVYPNLPLFPSIHWIPWCCISAQFFCTPFDFTNRLCFNFRI